MAVISGDEFHIGRAAGGLNGKADGFYRVGMLTGCGDSGTNRHPRTWQGRLLVFNRYLVAGLAPIRPWC
jgi:hypothetical protein